MISVVIPAHDEERAIGRCLTTLLAGSERGEIEVVVACNGCTDATAEVAARFGPPVRVVSTSVASKREALNLGDATATGFPRFYVDADVGLGMDAVRAIAAALDEGAALVAAPALSVDVSASSPLVRSYYRVYGALPSIRADIVGRGVYALSRQGRARFDEFPEVTGDDHFVRSVFSPWERRCVETARSVVGAPRSVRGLVRRKARIVAGNAVVDRMAEGNEGVRRGRGLWAALRSDPSLAVHVPAYLGVGLAARLVVRAAAARGRDPEWGRDDSRSQWR